MIKNKKRKLNYNYIILFNYIIWFALIIFYFLNSEIIKAGQLNGLINYGKDSILYIDKANLIAKFQFNSIPISKFSYIFLLSIPIILNLNFSVIVIFQFFTTILSSFCLYKIGSNYSRKKQELFPCFFFNIFTYSIEKFLSFNRNFIYKYKYCFNVFNFI